MLGGKVKSYSVLTGLKILQATLWCGFMSKDTPDTKDKPLQKAPSQKAVKAEERRARLAEEMRNNLLRRKGQKRDRRDRPDQD